MATLKFYPDIASHGRRLYVRNTTTAAANVAECLRIASKARRQRDTRRARLFLELAREHNTTPHGNGGAIIEAKRVQCATVGGGAYTLDRATVAEVRF